MQVICRRQALQQAFSSVASVAPNNSVRPILANVLIQASDSGVVLQANNLEVGVRVSVPCEGFVWDGSALLPVDRFGAILRELSCAEITIEAKAGDNGVTVSGQRSRFELPSQDVDEYPVVSEFTSESYHLVDGQRLRLAIKRTCFATDPNTNHFALGGVLVEFHEKEIIMVGTDGRRGSIFRCEAESVGGHAGPACDVIVPVKALQAIEKAVDGEEEVKIFADSNTIHVATAHSSVSARLVEGRFPKWREIEKKPGQYRVPFPAGELLAAVRQAAIVSDKESRGVELLFQDSSLRLASAVKERGKSSVTIDSSHEGPDEVFTLDHRYLIEFLKAVEPDHEVGLRFENSNQKVTLGTEDGSNYIVMPMSSE